MSKNVTMFATSFGRNDSFDNVQLSINSSQALRLIKLLATALESDKSFIRLSVHGIVKNGVDLADKNLISIVDAPDYGKGEG